MDGLEQVFWVLCGLVVTGFAFFVLFMAVAHARRRREIEEMRERQHAKVLADIEDGQRRAAMRARAAWPSSSKTAQASTIRRDDDDARQRAADRTQELHQTTAINSPVHTYTPAYDSPAPSHRCEPSYDSSPSYSGSSDSGGSCGD